VSLTAFECGLDDFGVGQLLDWLIPNSAATLRSLSFEANQISSISSKFNSFQSLYSIYIQENKADLTVKNNSFYASINQQMIIDLSGSQVIRVEPNSFIGIFLSFIFNAIIIFKLNYIFFITGNYSSTDVRLTDNLLTRFEEGVFKSMLQVSFGLALKGQPKSFEEFLQSSPMCRWNCFRRLEP